MINSIFCNNVNVLTVTFDNVFKKKNLKETLLSPNFNSS